MSLAKSFQKFKLNQQYVLFTAVRNHWNRDYKPDKLPQTQSERNAAATKYGMDPGEYQTYPDDGRGLGDYPKLPDISGDARDNYYPWDNPELKRNFGETIHADADLIGEDRYDVTIKHRVPGWKQWAQFLGVLFGTFSLYWWCERAKMFPAILPKQYPYQGKTHYTFEPKE